MNLKRILMKGEKMSFHLSVLGLSVSLFAASGLGFFASPIAAQTRNSDVVYKYYNISIHKINALFLKSL
jgi:hypothetical protein